MRIIFLAALLGASCASLNGSQGSRENPLSICTIIDGADKYDKKNVLVDGIFRLTPHGALFYGKQCPENFVRLRNAQEYSSNISAERELKAEIDHNKTAPVHIVYKAKFRVIHGTECSETYCFKYQLDVNEIISANPG
jgi:hypothetical protein